MIDKIQLLKKVKLFSALRDEDLPILAKMAKTKHYEKNSTILLESDDKNQSLFIIAKGKVKVFISGIDGKEALLSILNQGEFFGEMSLLDNEPRSASVKALEKSELLVIRRDDFLQELINYPKLSMVLLVEMSKRIRKADKQISSLTLMSVYGRIAAILMELIEEHGEIIRMIDGSVVKIIRNRPSHQQLAAMVGATRETVSRALTHLQNKGFLALNGKDIYIFQDPNIKGQFEN